MISKNQYKIISKYQYIKSDNIITLVLLAVVSAMLGLVLPFSILIIFDRVIPNQSYTTLSLIYVIIAVSVIFDTKVKAIEEKFTAKITRKFEKDTTAQIFHAFCHADIARFKNMSEGEYLERIRTIPALKNYFGGDAVKTIVNSVTCAIVFLIILIINFFAGLTLLSASALLYFISDYMSKHKTDKIEKKSTLEGRTSSKIIEMVSHPLNLKTSSMEYRMENFMNKAVEKREDCTAELEKTESSLAMSLDFIQQLSIAAVVVSCALSVINLNMSQGGMAAIILLTNRYFAPFRQIASMFGQWKINNMQLRRVKQMLSLEAKGEENDDIIIPKKIVIKTTKLYNFRQGHIYVITGEPCTGKSHLMKLITLEEHSNNIQILINNKALDEYDYSKWKNSVVNVNAYTSFIEGTIIENITCFRPKLHKAAYALCEAMNIKHIIDGLPRGFYTEMTGAKNYPFSRQVHFALLVIRAMLCKKSVFIIDDIDLVVDKEFARNLIRCIESGIDTAICLLISNKMDINSRNFSTIAIDKIIAVDKNTQY